MASERGALSRVRKGGEIPTKNPQKGDICGGGKTTENERSLKKKKRGRKRKEMKVRGTWNPPPSRAVSGCNQLSKDRHVQQYKR